MKPYKDPTRFRWRCPICFIEKTSGGLGHIKAQACGHMRRKHDIYEFADYYIGLGLDIAKAWLEYVTQAQKDALLKEASG